MTYSAINKNIITIPQGSDYLDTVTVNQPGGVPMDLSGYTVRSQLRTLAGALVATFACTIPAPATGVINRTINNVGTAALVPSPNVQHTWGIEMTAPSGAILPEIQGGAMVTAEVVI